MLPLATTKQFRKVAMSVLKRYGLVPRSSYTDRPRSSMGAKRYCSYWFKKQTLSDSITEQIEFELWCQGVTAQTRFTGTSLRATCILEKKMNTRIKELAILAGYDVDADHELILANEFAGLLLDDMYQLLNDFSAEDKGTPLWSDIVEHFGIE